MDHVQLFGEIPEPILHDEYKRKACSRSTPAKDMESRSDVSKGSQPREVKTCRIDHFKDGFEGQTVYAWRGSFKGKIGTVMRVSGLSVRVNVDSAILGKSVLDIPSDCLVTFVNQLR